MTFWNNTMNASEARRIATHNNEQIHKLEFTKIMTNIKARVESGHYDCWVHDDLHPSTVGRLQELEYKVESVATGMNETGTQISW